MTKISDLPALEVADVSPGADLVPIVDVSEAGAARNKKITVAELLALALSNEAIDDRVAQLLVQGTNVTLEYNDLAGTITINASTPSTGDIAGFNEAVDDRVAALLKNGAGVSLAYNDAAGTLTISAGGSAFDNSTNEARLNALEGSHVVLTQAAYDALDPPDPDTIYLIPEA